MEYGSRHSFDVVGTHYVVGAHWKHLAEALLVGTLNICFHGEIRKISIIWFEKRNKKNINITFAEKSILSRAMAEDLLTLKMPRKPVSENVVCLCCLLNILANFSNLFLHTGK